VSIRWGKDRILNTSLQDSKRYTTYVDLRAPGLVIRQLVMTSDVEEGSLGCDWQATAESSPGLY